VVVTQRQCRITVPGLSIKRDFTAARQRLLDDFPNVHEVVATTAPATLLVLYSGSEDPAAWLDALLDSVATRQVTATGRLLRERGVSVGGDDSAA
jgi:hypothetical protein